MRKIFHKSRGQVLVIYTIALTALLAGVTDTPPASPFADRAGERSQLTASPPVVMTVVRVSACPWPIVLDSREARRRDDLRNHHRMHRARVQSDDLGGGETRHRHHEDSEHRGNHGRVDFHKCLFCPEYGCGYLPVTRAKRLLMLCFGCGPYEKSEFVSIASLTPFYY